MPISGSAMWSTVTPAPSAASVSQRWMACGIAESGRSGSSPRRSSMIDRSGLSQWPVSRCRCFRSSCCLGCSCLGCSCCVPAPVSASRGVGVAVLEIVVRHVEAVADAALDRLHRRAVTVLAQVLVGFGGPHQRLDNFAFHQPAARGHGREPERGLVEPLVALAGRRRGELGLNPLECRHRIGAAALVAGLAVVRLAGFLTLRRAQDLLDPARQRRRLMDRRRVPATAVQPRPSGRRAPGADHETAGAADVDRLAAMTPRPLPSASPLAAA